MKQIFVFVIIVISLYPIEVNAQQCNLKIAGHVEDEHTKDKLEGATVRLINAGRQVLTNNQGDFVFDSLCAGTYTLQVSHVDCETVIKKIQLTKHVHLDVLMPHAQNLLEEVTVSAYKPVPPSGYKQEIKGRELESLRGRSLADALDRVTGVTTLRTGTNVSKPVVHGLHGNRLLLINNGIRQEGQQWGNEHAPEVDPFIADKLTVIKGVDELKYGSDAIGGVVIVDAKPLRHLEGWSSEFFTGYSTNGRRYYASANLEQQLKKIPITYRLQATYRRGANTRTPDYYLNNTGMREYNFSATAGFKRDHFFVEGYFSRFNTKAGIFTGSHIGNLQDLQTAIEADRPNDIYTGEKTYKIKRPYQDVTHTLIKLRSGWQKGTNKINLTFGAQANERQEFDRSRSDQNTRPQLDLLIYSFTEDLSWDHQLGRLKGTLGAAFMQQDNSFSGRYFIPNYKSFTYGAYWIEKLNLQKWEFHAGIRADYKNVDTRRKLSNGSEVDHKFSFNTIASSLNVVFKPTEHFKINAAANLSGRAPHVNELLSNGIHHGTATYEEGNTALKVERSLNTSLGFEFETQDKTLSIQSTVFVNNIRDYIYRRPVPDEPVLTIAGAFPKVVFDQTDARLSGLDAEINWWLNRNLQWSVQASLLRAKDADSDQWLVFMPSDRLSTDIVFNFKDLKKLELPYISGELVHVFKQTRVPSDENGKHDYKQPPAAYTLLNLNAFSGIRIANFLFEAGVTVDNLLNIRYRDYLNSFRYFTDEMGRNISLKIKIPIDQIK